ncbi:hypothetical protein SNOG_20102 [Parastagonospora nodorum SN15]|uniref:Uncharacterized protein n=1 Tax=Phaeosphaeria nodorum (strain SN15 / ATCC MYA-4574 / FGSC 10173) TaxID=321614 RepID=A9JXA0_PHANO|nr:hypothetical protein SNOG_20102 [Parastagonospora nodorum SN15]EDP89791.1 hypothetical protein SNOG_20102 [Parastagonospora nodorum SN15]
MPMSKLTFVNPTKRGPSAQATGKMTPSTIILLVFGFIFELWIVFALVYALFTRKSGRPYLARVKNALMFQLR